MIDATTNEWGAAPARSHRSHSALAVLGAAYVRRISEARGAVVGRDTFIHPNTHMRGYPQIRVGRGCEILRGCTIEADRSDGEVALTIGNHSRIKENVWLASYGGSVHLGDHVLLGRNSVIHGHGGVTIGDWSMMGPNVTIVSAEHLHDIDGARPYQAQGERCAPVRIGTNVWIGTGVVILPGVDIADGAVIGAGAVVTKSIRVPGVWVGVPAREIGPVNKR